MRAFAEQFRVSASTTVLDIGGAPETWDLLPIRPQVTLLNIWPLCPWRLPERMQYVHGDARATGFADSSFDLAFSNSVIEHVGTWEDQRRFAEEVRRIARDYYVQTPNRAFPIEPHYAAPFVHWLPQHVQRRILRYATPWGWLQRPTQAYVDRVVAEIRLLDEREVRTLFPDATISVERVCGFAKSFIAVRLAH